MINKKALMLISDPFAIIGILILLGAYMAIMIGFGVGGYTYIYTNDFSFTSVNLYSYLESPVDDSRMVDLLREYVESDFSDINLENKIKDESIIILRKLNFCANENSYHSFINLENEDNELRIFSSNFAEDLYLKRDQDSLSSTTDQRIPYDDGIFFVSFGAFIEDDDKGCSEVVSV